MKMDGVRNYQNYIFICVRNQALKYLNYQSKHQKIKLEQTEMRHLSDSATPEQDVLDYELKNIVDLTVDSLPRRCRLIYHTVREGGLKYREVADILSISERTVHAQMCIALKRLGKAVKEYRMCKETVK
jgi:RNA polymerase sigma-70 factor (ECF subfamily)